MREGRKRREENTRTTGARVNNMESLPLGSSLWLRLGQFAKGNPGVWKSTFRKRTCCSGNLQHRVKNNLQMITALIRLEARNTHEDRRVQFDRLAGRIESLALLYSALSEHHDSKELDLGIYLSQIAAALMKSHATEGIRLELKVDAYPVSVNVAMPTGLVVNELLTNSLKHAFVGRDSGTIKLHSLVDENGCRIVVGDDGVGYPPDIGMAQAR